MRCYSILVLLVIVCIVPFNACASSHISNTQRFMVHKDKTLIFVGQDGDTIKQYVQKTGLTPTGVMFYTSVQRMEGLLSVIDIGAGPQHGTGLLEQYPNAAIQIGLYMVDALNGILAGTFDANLDILANWLIKADRLVFLRIGYEFDNPDNHYDPTLYKNAYRHIVTHLYNKGVRNTAYVWHSYTAEKQKYEWNEWYPGDNYVDWFGASIFSTGNIPYAENFLKVAKRHHKPFMIAESSPMGMYTVHGKKDWFNHVFRFINKNNIQTFCYINSNWDVLPMYKEQHWGDARVEKDQEVMKLWLEEVRKSRYIKPSSNLFLQLDCHSNYGRHK